MSNKGIWLFSIGAVICVASAFAYAFKDQVIGDEIERWSHFGGYFGGTLGPILTFLTIVLLIKTLDVQLLSHEHLKEEVSRSKQLEKIKTFESHFFNLIESQRKNYEEFSVVMNGSKIEQIEAVNALENLLIYLKEHNAPHEKFVEAAHAIDSNQYMFNIIRIFFVITKLIDSHLSKDEGFEDDVREKYFETLIFLTDFNLLRLICMSLIVYKEAESSKYILNNKNIKKHGKSTGLSKYMYKIAPESF